MNAVAVSTDTTDLFFMTITVAAVATAAVAVTIPAVVNAFLIDIFFSFVSPVDETCFY